MILTKLKEKIMAKTYKYGNKPVVETTEEAVPTTPVPEVNDEGFNV